MGGDDTLTLDASLGTLLLGTLLGGNGNDTLISGLGNDTLDGGADIDTASYTQATVGVRVNLSLATIQTTVGAGKDKLLGFENLTGSNWNDSLTGDSQNNVLAGGNGNDTLVGGAGRDSFYGDGGNDSFFIDSTDSGGGNLAGVVRGGEGIDTVTIAAGSGAVQLNLTSGQPFSVASGVDNARTGTGGQRVDYSGNAVIGGDRSRNDVVSEYLRRSVFSPNALGTFGTIGRNTYYGPGLANVDFGLAKNFRANDRLTTTFRFEAFNALNRVNLGNPVNAQNNGNFMRITGTTPPRVLQLALRLVF